MPQPYSLNDTKVTGTFDSPYTKNKIQLQLVIDGKIEKQIVYNPIDTAREKENEELTIVVKVLIIEKINKSSFAISKMVN